MEKQIENLKKLRPCPEALNWVLEQNDPQQAWDDCERGDWMLWLLGKIAKGLTSKSRKQLVLIACECARLKLKHVPEGEARPRIAIETAEAWTRGEATLAQVRTAVDAADAYAAVTYHSNSAAYAAAYAAADAAVAPVAAAVGGVEILKQCADIVRKHHPKTPKF
jgi:hypothetical protein